MMRLILSLLCLSIVSFANAGEDLYKNAEALYQTGVVPNVTEMNSGWYTGRCYTRRDPSREKSGVLVIVPEPQDASHTLLKQLMPPASIQNQADFFDEITQAEYDYFKDDLFEKENFYARRTPDALVSELYYDSLIGYFHTRQIGQNYILAMTSAEDAPDTNSNAQFYCVFTKKVRDL